MTSPEHSSLSSLPSSSDGAAVGLTTALGTTACTEGRAISGAVASKVIAHGENDGNNQDDEDNGEGGGALALLRHWGQLHQ
jgi:hypothetical protein